MALTFEIISNHKTRTSAIQYYYVQLLKHITGNVGTEWICEE